ncbi:MAG TPA: hypothetical protein PKA28_07450 [Methylomusa anaerophila]|uniref:Uncharacterized protein n=1 Tax=Methylomusa anaerophila TaxID=1930071 RepID=A0A348AG04_9FIRM|nr:hypothetical protein [Methylomusa anaerophila]BBB90002.1 hypothetical protein MAMMFC1_00646 [Methylomusa anaerophila]HML88269.1 hypothetical protein [Methylomusa anaerophila]
MGILLFLLVLAGGIAFAVWLYIAKQGDAKFEFIVDQRSNFTLDHLTRDSAAFSTIIPFVNKGTQDGTIMDAYPRHLLPYEQFDGAEVQSRLTLATAGRTDGYWEAAIIPKKTGGSIILTVKFTAKNGDIVPTLHDMINLPVDMAIDIVYQVVARSSWYIAKNRLIMTAGDIKQALDRATGSAA